MLGADFGPKFIDAEFRFHAAFGGAFEEAKYMLTVPVFLFRLVCRSVFFCRLLGWVFVDGIVNFFV